MRTFAAVLSTAVALSLAACGDDGGTGGGIDAPPVPTTITVTGFAQTVSGTTRGPLAGANIQAFQGTGTTPIATTTSAADGSYTLTLTTDGGAIDGYVKGTSTGRLDTYLYPPRPLSADTTGATLLIVNQATVDLLALAAGLSQDAGKGMVAVLVRDPAGNPVTGATVTVSPMGTATIKYAAGTNSLPGTAAATDANGLAYVFNTNLGTLTVGAAAGGVTYHSHPLEARVGVVTTTAVEP